MTANESNRIAHYVSSFLPTTCNWIYPQIVRPSQYEGWVVTHERLNEEQFPFERTVLSPTSPVMRYRDMSILRRMRFTREMRSSIQRVTPVLVHAHFGGEGACIARAAQQLGIPLITSFYGSDLAMMRYPWWRRRYRYLFRVGTRFLCEGPFAMKQLVGIGCPKEKCRTLRLGVDLAKIPYRKREDRKGERVRILIASSLREKKGVEYGVRAFAKCCSRSPETDLTIIGDGPLRAEVESAIVSSGVGQRVQMLGYVSHDAFRRQLYDSDIFLVPSVTAVSGDTEGGSPVGITEAAASGLPVVSSFHADIPEVVLHEESGLLAPERDVEQLAGHLLRLVSSKELRDAMGLRGREHVEKNFSLKAEIGALESCYAEVCEEE